MPDRGTGMSRCARRLPMARGKSGRAQRKARADEGHHLRRGPGRLADRAASSGEKNDVTVVDNNPELVRRATDTLDVQGVAGFATYPDVLERAGARDADMIIAATYSDEVNMVTCQVAHSVFGIPRKIARLRAQSYLTAIYSDLYRRDHLPIDVVISPEREVAEAALRRLAAPSTFDTESFMGGRAAAAGHRAGRRLPGAQHAAAPVDRPVFDPARHRRRACAATGRLFAPEPGDQLFAGDQIYVFSHIEDVNRTLEIFGKSHEEAGTRRHHRRRQCRPGGRAGAGDTHRPDPRQGDRARPRAGRTGRRRAGTHHRAERRRDEHGDC